MTPPAPIVHLVDDEPAIVKALSRLLRAAGHRTEAFSAPQAFLDGVNEDAAGCAVLDLAMPGLNGLELMEKLASRGCTLPVIFLTGCGDIPASVRAMKRGAVDFLTKPVNDADLLSAVERALARDRAQRANRAEMQTIRRRLALLTPREAQVLTHMITGKMNKQVAADLGTVEKTIKVHRARVFEKLAVDSVADLVRLAEKAGIAPAGKACETAPLKTT